MVNFAVIGPYDVPTVSGIHGGKILERKRTLKREIQEAARDHPKISGPGCYVFSCATGRGSIPLYVGKATSNILSEAFNDRNINNLNHFLLNRKKGKIQRFAIYQERVRLFGNADLIGQIEEFLIGFAALRNRDLLNIHGTAGARWTIAGVANNGGGNPGISATAFKKMMGMQTKAARKSQRSDDEIHAVDVESETPSSAEVIAIHEEIEEKTPPHPNGSASAEIRP